MTIYERALEFVADGAVVGLGSGRASTEFIKLVGARVRAGLHIRGVPTSQHSADLAKTVGIPLVSLEEGMPLAVTVDGADEVDPHLNCIKGWGRARACARRLSPPLPICLSSSSAQVRPYPLLARAISFLSKSCRSRCRCAGRS